MSIIYDALNKTKEIRSSHANRKEVKTSNRLWFLLGSFIIFFLLIIIAILFHSLYQHYLSTTTHIAIKQSSTPQKITKHYLLSGIFLSDAHQVAIINHTHYHIGEQIDGMKIIGIGANHVKLQDKNHTMILSMIH